MKRSLLILRKDNAWPVVYNQYKKVPGKVVEVKIRHIIIEGCHCSSWMGQKVKFHRQIIILYIIHISCNINFNFSLRSLPNSQGPIICLEKRIKKYKADVIGQCGKQIGSRVSELAPQSTFTPIAIVIVIITLHFIFQDNLTERTVILWTSFLAHSISKKGGGSEFF